MRCVSQSSSLNLPRHKVREREEEGERRPTSCRQIMIESALKAWS